MCIGIQCQCGYHAEMDEYTRTEIGGELPAGTYQCPNCGFAWKLETVTEAKRMPGGWVYPGEKKLVPIPRHL